jgi:hypothetical protein
VEQEQEQTFTRQGVGKAGIGERLTVERDYDTAWRATRREAQAGVVNTGRPALDPPRKCSLAALWPHPKPRRSLVSARRPDLPEAQPEAPAGIPGERHKPAASRKRVIEAKAASEGGAAAGIRL